MCSLAVGELQADEVEHDNLPIVNASVRTCSHNRSSARSRRLWYESDNLGRTSRADPSAGSCAGPTRVSILGKSAERRRGIRGTLRATAGGPRCLEPRRSSRSTAPADGEKARGELQRGQEDEQPIPQGRNRAGGGQRPRTGST